MLTALISPLFAAYSAPEPSVLIIMSPSSVVLLPVPLALSDSSHSSSVPVKPCSTAISYADFPFETEISHPESINTDASKDKTNIIDVIFFFIKNHLPDSVLTIYIISLKSVFE